MINFSINSPLQNVRLIEVSQEIVDIVESDKPVLQFKSALDSILHLCSEDKAWAIKQVSTSNSVYLIQPDIDKINNGAAVTATSQVRNFLELHPSTIDEAEIESTIATLLPIQTNLTDPPEPNGLSYNDLIANIPSPDTIVHKLSTRLCVSELNTAFTPATSAILATWTHITETCAIELIKLDHALDTSRIIDVLTLPLAKAIGQTLLRPSGTLEQRGLFESNTSARYLKPLETCCFIGELMLRGSSSTNSDSELFMRQWTNLVPSSWVKHCTVDTLRTMQHVTIDERDWISSNLGADGPLFGRRRPVSADVSVDMNDTASSKTTATGKKKWHEKFGAQRNTKR